MVQQRQLSASLARMLAVAVVSCSCIYGAVLFGGFWLMIGLCGVACIVYGIRTIRGPSRLRVGILSIVVGCILMVIAIGAQLDFLLARVDGGVSAPQVSQSITQ